MTRSRSGPKGYIRRRGNRYWIAVPRGTDPITKRYTYVYDSADSLEQAQRRRDELLARVAEGREPTEKVTVSTLLDKWLDVADLAVRTRVIHQGYIDRTIRPVLGKWNVRKLERRVDVLDQLYAHLRRCSKLCDGRPYIEHRGLGGDRARAGGGISGARAAGAVSGQAELGAEHDCRKAGCAPHECRPMAASTIRRIHSIVSAAYGFAIKWGWADRNPADHVSPPRLNAAGLEPPDVSQAARLLRTAWERDPAFGTFLWLAVVTGARRGELVALRWTDIRWAESDLLIQRGYVTRPGQRIIKDTKTHQKRRLSLDPATIKILRAHRKRQQEDCSKMGMSLPADGYVFTRDGLDEQPGLPDSVTQRFDRMRDKLGLNCRLHDLRHYTATQLLSGGIDLRTVAGRLGHSGGGSTTLKVYAHWSRPSDQRAAEMLARGLPMKRVGVPEPGRCLFVGIPAGRAVSQHDHARSCGIIEQRFKPRWGEWAAVGTCQRTGQARTLW